MGLSYLHIGLLFINRTPIYISDSPIYISDSYLHIGLIYISNSYLHIRLSYLHIGLLFTYWTPIYKSDSPIYISDSYLYYIREMHTAMALWPIWPPIFSNSQGNPETWLLALVPKHYSCDSAWNPVPATPWQESAYSTSISLLTVPWPKYHLDRQWYTTLSFSSLLQGDAEFSWRLLVL